MLASAKSSHPRPRATMTLARMGSMQAAARVRAHRGHTVWSKIRLTRHCQKMTIKYTDSEQLLAIRAMKAPSPDPANYIKYLTGAWLAGPRESARQPRPSMVHACTAGATSSASAANGGTQLPPAVRHQQLMPAPDQQARPVEGSRGSNAARARGKAHSAAEA